MKTGIVWHEGIVYTMGEGDATERVFHYCTADYNGVHIEIIPTNVICGNKHYGEHDVKSFIFTMGVIDGICVGYSSKEYPTFKAAKDAAYDIAKSYVHLVVKGDDDGTGTTGEGSEI